MRLVLACVLVVACGGSDPVGPAPPPKPAPVATTTVARPIVQAAAQPATPPCAAGVPREACERGAERVCGRDDRSGEWRYAVIAGLFEVDQDVPLERIVTAWRAGEIAATADTQAALAPILGESPRAPLAAGTRPSVDEGWAIVPAHELMPAWRAIAIDGKHPLAAAPGALAVPLCGGTAVRNIDPEHVTTLVMSGTTAITRRIAERVAASGAKDTVRAVAPFFKSADLVHISNETSYVRDCDPYEPEAELVFCTRDRDIAVLEQVNARIVELTGSHLVDFGSNTLVRTIEMYKQRGWQWYGGGRTQIEATRPLLVEHHGNKLAFLGCNAVGTWLRGISNHAGVAACDWPKMTWQVQDLRRRGYTPIVSVQHSEVLRHDPPAGLVRDLRRFAIAGAAFVLGSQAHSAHPWDVHHGAFVHYGPGNIFFAQHGDVVVDASVDKLYIHAGRLLAVEQMYTRISHGAPRVQTPRERARFLGQMAAAAAQLEPADPWHEAALPAETRTRPDSVVVRGKLQKLAVTVPATYDPAQRYPLVIDMIGGAAPSDDGFLVAPVESKKVRATAAEIAAFMAAKYRTDPKRTSILAPEKPKRSRHRRRH